MAGVASPSPYYQHSRKVPLASQLSWLARQRIFEAFVRVVTPCPEMRVLDVGATLDTNAAESNFFERLYPHKDALVCAGVEDASHLETLYPGVRFQRIAAGEPLPFAPKSFDVVFSNAVIEHVGNTEQQRRFVEDLRRVGRRVFLATPNRWFPIEPHTGLPLLHYLPKPTYRALLARTSYAYWASEENLNLLTLRQLAALFPPDAGVVARRVGIGWGPWRSNLIAYT